MDISPKGDAPGFVRVLDDKTLAVPDRPGNRRADTFMNVLENPKGRPHLLRSGKKRDATRQRQRQIVRDADLRESMAARWQDTRLRTGRRGRRSVLSLLEMHCPFEPVDTTGLAGARWPSKSRSDNGGCAALPMPVEALEEIIKQDEVERMSLAKLSVWESRHDIP